MTSTHPVLAGKVIMLTGATDGIGRETVRRLLQVADETTTFILHGRSEGKMSEAVAFFKDVNPTPALKTYFADYASFQSVSDMCRVIRGDVEGIDILYQNAGCAVGSYTETIDGWEKTCQVNFLSAALLGLSLRDIVRERIIFTSSDGQFRSRARVFEDIDWQSGYHMMQVYAESKNCITAFAKALANDIGGVPVVFSMHPGTVGTNIIPEMRGQFGMDISQADDLFRMGTEDKWLRMNGLYFSRQRKKKSAKMAPESAWATVMAAVEKYLRE